MAKKSNNVPAKVKVKAQAVGNVIPLGDKVATSLKRDINAYIKRVSTIATSDLHALAFRCIKHFHDHGDTEPMLQLVNGIPKSFRRLELARWFAELSPAKFGKRDQKTDLFLSCVKDKSETAKLFDLKTAEAVPFYDAPEPPMPKGLTDILKLLQSKRKSYAKMLEDKGIPRKGNISDAEIEAEIGELDAGIAFYSKRPKAKQA